MRIHVCGKAHRRGVSKKTGNPYDFIQIFYLGRGYGVEGLESKSLNLEPREYNFDTLRVDADYEVEFDERGYCVGLIEV